MYIPRHFEIDDKEEAFAFIEANAFGQLISTVSGRLFSSHIPFLLDADGSKVVGHLAQENPQHKELDQAEVLVTFQGPHDYISPSWYSAPGVPTWNYQAVHLYGQCRVFHNPEKLKSIVDSLTNKYESSLREPWRPSYKPAMLGAIVGVEIQVSEIQCKYKLSQNRSDQDRAQVIEQLKALGSAKLAEAMERHG